jgi:hypothetical protein
MSKWELTDDDCAQYTRRYGDYVFGFMEVEERTDAWYVVRGLVDLTLYGLSDLRNFCSPYYGDNPFVNIMLIYGEYDALRIIAKIVFKSDRQSVTEFVVKCDSLEEAQYKIANLIKMDYR